MEPKTAVKKSEAASCLEVLREALGTRWWSVNNQKLPWWNGEFRRPTSSKVGNVTQYVENSNHKKRNRCCSFECFDGGSMKWSEE